MRFGEQLIPSKLFSNSPCCLDFLDRPNNLYIVGSYELNSSEHRDGSADPSNQRRGSLSVFEDGHLLFESCNLTDGGVFDLKILSLKLIAVAHSNGYIVFYEVNYERKVIDCLLRHDTQFALLTSIDVSMTEDANIYGVVGTSEGSIVIFEGNLVKREMERCITLQENIIEQPVWCTRVIASHCPGQRFLLFTGSDDCTMKVFHVTQQTANSTLLCKNNDAGSGITDIYIEPSSESLSDDIYSKGFLYTGSYDEYLRKYSFIYTDNLFKLQLLQSVHLKGAGIWSIRYFDSFLFIAGMFSGVHIVHPNDLSVLCSRSVDCDENDGCQGEASQLIYDIIAFQGAKKVAIVSFYKKALYLLSVHEDCKKKDEWESIWDNLH